MSQDPQTSKYRFYSFGQVANNKPPSSDMIQVTPIEALTMLDGEIISAPMAAETKGTDASGIAYQTKVKTDNAIEAKWMPMRSNRRTAPDVRRGERVFIWQYADTDKYYWTETGWDDHLRKLETAIFSFSGTMDEAADSLDPVYCYSFEISTHTGNVTLRTSKANGEFCLYSMQFNTKDGRVLLTDELGNQFEMDSKKSVLQLLNADKTNIKIDKRTILFYAPDSITAKADKSMLLQTKSFKLVCDTYRLECSSGSVKGNMTFENPVVFNSTVRTEGKITANGGLDSPTVPVKGPTKTLN